MIIQFKTLILRDSKLGYSAISKYLKYTISACDLFYIKLRTNIQSMKSIN